MWCEAKQYSYEAGCLTAQYLDCEIAVMSQLKQLLFMMAHADKIVTLAFFGKGPRRLLCSVNMSTQ